MNTNCWISIQKGTITFTESVGLSLFPAILGSVTTSQMNFITLSHVYCLYPSLTVENTVLNTFNAVPYQNRCTPLSDNQRQSLSYQGLFLKEDGAGGDCPCECPVIRRAVNGFRRISVFQWGGYEFMKKTEANCINSYDCHYIWQLGLQCRNSHCMNFSGKNVVDCTTDSDLSMTSQGWCNVLVFYKLSIT